MIDLDESDKPIEDIIRSGKAVAIYEFDYSTAIERYSKKYPFADYWYIERNGDPITLFVPKGTKYEDLPERAKGYLTWGWGKHDD